MTPEESAIRCETALRTVMQFAYSRAIGEDWIERVVGSRERGVWRKRRSNDAASGRVTKGVVGLPEPDFNYAQLSDLIKILDSTWDPVADIFPDKEEALVFLRRFSELRNPGAHGRPLYGHEWQLMQGIADQTRSQITIYMSGMDEAGDYYPRIEAMWNNMGYRYDCGPRDIEYMNGVHETEMTLRPGDVLTLSGTAVDPQGRPLRWTGASNRSGELSPPVTVASGEVAEFNWVVTDEDVAESNCLTFQLLAEGTPYHRSGTFDFIITFNYRVRPPLS